MKKRIFKFLGIAVLAAILSVSLGCEENKTLPITGVTITPEVPVVYISDGNPGTLTLKAVVEGTKDQKVTWSILETDRNPGTVINESGELTVAYTETLKLLTIEATSAAIGKSGTVSVTIKTPDPFDITASELVAAMTIGWNLGNALDAWSSNNPDRDYSGLSVQSLETLWVSNRATQSLITAVKNAGFNTIRIPVTWHKAANANADYEIRADWIDRVKEVVNYAAAADMYIILNTHHDEHIFKFTNSTVQASLIAFEKIWEQIAFAFKDYNEKLIFEGLNEPRTKGSTAEWTGGTAEERANLNRYYKVFVDTVRSSGGNNGNRILMINTYAASGEAAAINGLVLPTDTVPNKLIVSIHSYAPDNFALRPTHTQTTWNNSGNDRSAITGRIDRAHTTFVSRGIPVIMGEFGSTNKNNEAERAKHAEFYVEYAKGKGIKCIWWDNHGFGAPPSTGENFGLIRRNNNEIVFPALLQALMSGATH